jgi:hypothetical protein
VVQWSSYWYFEQKIAGSNPGQGARRLNFKVYTLHGCCFHNLVFIIIMPIEEKIMAKLVCPPPPKKRKKLLLIVVLLTTQPGFISGSKSLHAWDVPLNNVEWSVLQDKWPNLADYAMKRPNFNKSAKGTSCLAFS